MSVAEKLHGYEQWEINEFIEERRAMESGRWEIHPNWRGTYAKKVRITYVPKKKKLAFQGMPGDVWTLMELFIEVTHRKRTIELQGGQAIKSINNTSPNQNDNVKIPEPIPITKNNRTQKY